ncbi:UDP-N-acetylmuramate--alanine ligase [Yoonia sp. R2331]|uniref:UDP-N-acetylmuramate--alanine ligase n=1 Tax=Yoonia sp. R2331 TaxID=3237238 RepID=UPI0034E595B7
MDRTGLFGGGIKRAALAADLSGPLAAGAVAGLMGGLVVFAIMVLGAFIPFGIVGYLVRAGKNGLALSIAAVIGAMLYILVWGSDGRLGIDPLLAISWAMLFFVPALIGTLAGGLLGWLMRRRDDRSI